MSRNTRRVGIDAHVLDGKHQGTATFAANILKVIARIETPFQTVIYCSKPDRVREIIGPSSFEFRRISEAGSVSRLLRIFPRLFKEDRIDLGIFQFITPPFGTVPTLVVVHDVLPVTHSELFPLGFRISRQILFQHSMRRACRILTVSETVKRDILKLFPNLVQSCDVATNGPSFDVERYFAADIPPLPDPLSPGDTYILAVGRVEKRKNIDLLIRAFTGANPPNVKLIIVGKRELGYRWRLPQCKAIVHLENIPNDQLLSLYRHAALFAFPSLAEGFGIPLLDALLAGTPTITSNQTAMPEVASGLARFFDPTTADAEATLTGILASHFKGEHPIARPILEQRRALSRRFDWDQSAWKLISSVEKALHKSAR